MAVTIGIIAEGYTDQLVIEDILLGVFGDDEPAITFVQPAEPSGDATGTYDPGGWTVLFRYLAHGGHREALQFNEVIVVHMDTDVCEEVGFDVPRTGLDDLRIIDAVRARLLAVMGSDAGTYAARIWFAIAVDSVECWLLPLLSDVPADRRKTASCLERADKLLRKADEAPLSRASGKDPERYRAVSRAFRKAKELQAAARHQVSLARFVDGRPEGGTGDAYGG